MAGSFDHEHLDLFTALARGECTISGFRNANLRRALPAWSAGKIACILKRLRLHRVIKKVRNRQAGLWSGFAEGNLLVCIRNINTIAVLARRDDRWHVVWVWGPGNLTFPHHPTVTPTGSLLIFNNGTEESEAVEMDPATGQVVWRYAPGPDRFFSRIRGSCQRLPNGKTLITEPDRGGVFEVTPEKEVVWRFANPAIQGDRREIIWRMVRFSPEDLPFLGGSRDPR